MSSYICIKSSLIATILEVREHFCRTLASGGLPITLSSAIRKEGPLKKHGIEGNYRGLPRHFQALERNQGGCGQRDCIVKIDMTLEGKKGPIPNQSVVSSEGNRNITLQVMQMILERREDWYYPRT
jgi:hypothetical protein